MLTGNPLPLNNTLTWTLNGQSLTDGDGVNLGLDFLQLSPINRIHAGTYNVTSSNIAGSATFEFMVFVSCEL